MFLSIYICAQRPPYSALEEIDRIILVIVLVYLRSCIPVTFTPEDFRSHVTVLLGDPTVYFKTKVAPPEHRSTRFSTRYFGTRLIHEDTGVLSVKWGDSSL